MRRFDNAYLLLTLTAFIWAGNAIAGRFADGHVSPMVLTVLRWTIAVGVVLPFAWRRLPAEWPTIRANALFLFAMGAVGYTVFNVLLYSALLYTSAINVTIEQSAMPLFIFILSFLLFRQRATAIQIGGFVLTAIGVTVVATYGDPFGAIVGEGGALNRGDALMLAGAFAYALYSALLPKKPKMDATVFLLVLMSAALVTAVAGVAVEAATLGSIWPSTLQGWLVVVYAGLFPSVVAQAFFIRGVESVGANRAGLFINLVPVFAALLSVLLLGEVLRPFHAVGFVLVVAGVLIAQRTVVRRAAA